MYRTSTPYIYSDTIRSVLRYRGKGENLDCLTKIAFKLKHSTGTLIFLSHALKKRFKIQIWLENRCDMKLSKGLPYAGCGDEDGVRASSTSAPIKAHTVTGAAPRAAGRRAARARCGRTGGAGRRGRATGRASARRPARRAHPLAG